MTGRKNPKMTEGEKVQEYRDHNRREGGMNIQGEEGEFTENMGGAGEIRRERLLHQREREMGEHP